MADKRSEASDAAKPTTTLGSVILHVQEAEPGGRHRVSIYSEHRFEPGVDHALVELLRVVIRQIEADYHESN